MSWLEQVQNGGLTQALGDPDEVRNLILHHIAPGLGCVIAFMMFASPMKAVLQVKRDRRLGDLNPLPLVAIIANCTGWLVYGCINKDPYVITANEPGLLLGIFSAIVCYGFAPIQVRDHMLKAFLFFAVVISSVCIYLSVAITDVKEQAQMAGYLAVFILLIYYAAPLSVLAQVLSTRNSASLYWPLALMSLVNGSLWVAYGLAVNDMFIWGPNGVGAALGVVQIVLIAIFPAKKSADSELDPLIEDTEAGDTHHDA